MISQQKCVRDPEMYSRTPEKLISLMPACSFIHCPPEGSSTVLDEEDATKSATYAVCSDIDSVQFVESFIAVITLLSLHLTLCRCHNFFSAFAKNILGPMA